MRRVTDVWLSELFDCLLNDQPNKKVVARIMDWLDPLTDDEIVAYLSSLGVMGKRYDKMKDKLFAIKKQYEQSSEVPTVGHDSK